QELWSDLFATDTEKRKILAQRINSILKSTIDSMITKGKEFVHQLSQPDENRLRDWIGRSLSWLPGRLQSVSMALEEKIRKLREIEESLQRGPENDVVGTTVSALNELYQELGGLQKESNILDEAIRSQEAKLREKDRSIHKILNEQEQIKKEQERL